MRGCRFRSRPAHDFDVFTARHKTHGRQVAAQPFVVPFAWYREAIGGRFCQSSGQAGTGESDSEKFNSEAEKKKKREGKIKGTGTPASPDLRFSLSAHGVRKILSGTPDFSRLSHHFSGARVSCRF